MRVPDGPRTLALGAALALAAPATPPRPLTTLPTGAWRAWLASPGGELPFELVLERDAQGHLAATVGNGPERIAVPAVRWDGSELRLEFDHYASSVVARLDEQGVLRGEWTRRGAGPEPVRMAFAAAPGAAPRFRREGTPPPAVELGGRWAADFESDELPAVAELAQEPDGTLGGTFLTATGDWRWLAGDVRGRTLRLSVFDGAHAFLLRAELGEDDVLRGDFWSRDAWHETWTARRDAAARVPDAFAQTAWDERVSLFDLVLPDLDGNLRSLAEQELAGRAVVLQLFGSWCPNCHDEGPFLADLFRRYRGRGLMVLGLAFELSGDFESDAAQVRRYAERHGCEYPFFVVGSARSKQAASRAFPAIDRLRAYPTTVFLTGDGRVRAVHSGFAGPAAGAEHEALKREFERLVEELLAEDAGPERGSEATWRYLAAAGWRRADGAVLELHEGSDGRRAARWRGTDGELPVRLAGEALLVGGTAYRLEREAATLSCPERFAGTLRREGEDWPLLAARGVEPGGRAEAARSATDPRLRREALAARVLEGDRDAQAAALVAGALEDPDPLVRAAAASLAAELGQALPPEPLAACLADPFAGVRREASRTLRALRDAAAARGDEAGRERVEACLGEELLRALHGDPDPVVREQAAALARPPVR